MASFDPTLRSSLYVGDLHPEVTEKDIADVFGRIGPLVSVHLCLDMFTHRSRCYAYVNFYFPSHAQIALNCLNHIPLKGKPIRVMWCQKEPIAKKNNTANLFVKNLHSSITTPRLEEIFSRFGKILSCKVVENKGISKGFGFVQFESETSATTAINALHGTMVEGKKLYVSKFLKKNETSETEPDFRNLYVKHIDDGITEDFLKATFSEYGNVCSAIIMKYRNGKSKGFGFVKFDTHEAAKKAIEALNGQQIGTKNLYVNRAQKRDERDELLRRTHKDNWNRPYDSRLYVMHLDSSVDDTKLEKLFGSYGEVTLAKVARYGNGISKGFGFVQFSCPDEANYAKNSLNGSYFEGRALFLSSVQKKEQHSRQLQKPYANFPPQPFSSCTNPQPLYGVSAPWFPALDQSYGCSYALYQSLGSSFALYQGSGRPFGYFYPVLAHNSQNIFFGPPMLFATSTWTTQDNHEGTGTNQTTTQNASNGFCEGSGTVNTASPRYAEAGNAQQLEITNPGEGEPVTLPQPVAAVNVRRSVQKQKRANITDFR